MGEKRRLQRKIVSVVHLLVHVENAQHAAQNGLLGLLGPEPLPEVSEGGDDALGGRGEDSS